MVHQMKIQLRRQEDVKIRTWINDRPISTSDWEVFYAEENSSEIMAIVKDPSSGNQLKISISKYHENSEENQQ
jgi:hypothetical protein